MVIITNLKLFVRIDKPAEIMLGQASTDKSILKNYLKLICWVMSVNSDNKNFFKIVFTVELSC